MHNGLIGSLLRSRLVSISGGGKLFVSLIALHHISFLLIWCQNFFQWSPTCITLVLFCILLQKCSLIWITFWAKLRLGRSHPAISSLFYLFILIYYLQWCSSLILRTCAYEGVRNVSFSKDFAYVLNRWPPIVPLKLQVSKNKRLTKSRWVIGLSVLEKIQYASWEYHLCFHE